MTLTTWFTVFLALVALSILIQAGILVGLYIAARRTKSFADYWEPSILHKVESIAYLIEDKTHVYSPRVVSGIDRLISYTQQVRLALSHQLQNIHQKTVVVNRKWLQPIASSIPQKKNSSLPHETSR